ncbi:hypothetical protein ACFL30_00975 [Candidatus Latescibacterota bacterium]
MKKIMFILIISMLFPVIVVHASVIDKAQLWVTGEVAAFALSALLTVMGAALGILFSRISRTFKEAGEFMTTLGTALEDKRITREELADIIKEGRDVFSLWRQP